MDMLSESFCSDEGYMRNIGVDPLTQWASIVSFTIVLGELHGSVEERAGHCSVMTDIATYVFFSNVHLELVSVVKGCFTDVAALVHAINMINHLLGSVDSLLRRKLRQKLRTHLASSQPVVDLGIVSI